MKFHPNFKVATIIGIIHFILGVGVLFMGASQSMSPRGGDDYQTAAFVLTLPLSIIPKIVSISLSGLDAMLLIGMAMWIQSFFWGILISLFFPKRSSED